jgi:hypothetical protein
VLTIDLFVDEQHGIVLNLPLRRISLLFEFVTHIESAFACGERKFRIKYDLFIGRML